MFVSGEKVYVRIEGGTKLRGRVQEGQCKGDCGAELNRILAGGPKLIYYNK